MRPRCRATGSPAGPRIEPIVIWAMIVAPPQPTMPLSARRTRAPARAAMAAYMPAPPAPSTSTSVSISTISAGSRSVWT